MATVSHAVPATRRRAPLALWHLLSLDAPTVAALWTWFLARANHIRLPLAAPAAMAVAVWMLYAADRLLDGRVLDAASPSVRLQGQLEARHFFHHRHRRGFLAGIAVAAVVLAALLPRLEPAAIRLYLSEGVLLFAWFLILHATRGAHRLPKEIAVGIFFAAATFIPSVAREPGLRFALLPAAVLFGALCSLNCLFIYKWEHAWVGRSVGQAAHATTRLALRWLTALTAGATVFGAALGMFDRGSPWPIATACAISSGLLMGLDRYQGALDEITLRAAADLALLSPLALMPFLR